MWLGGGAVVCVCVCGGGGGGGEGGGGGGVQLLRERISSLKGANSFL